MAARGKRDTMTGPINTGPHPHGSTGPINTGQLAAEVARKVEHSCDGVLPMVDITPLLMASYESLGQGPPEDDHERRRDSRGKSVLDYLCFNSKLERILF